jgi:hypothetical protein
MQKLVEAHDTKVGVPLATACWFHHDEPFQVNAFPASSSAMQKLVDGQEMEAKLSLYLVIVAWGADHDEPFHAKKVSSLSTAMQKFAEGHETDRRPSYEVDMSICCPVQDEPFHQYAMP